MQAQNYLTDLNQNISWLWQFASVIPLKAAFYLLLWVFPFIPGYNIYLKKQLKKASGVLYTFNEDKKIKITWWGFQSLSKIITVSAAWRFKPSPPALVLSKKMKYCDPGSLNFFKRAARSSDFVVPEKKKLKISYNKRCELK